MKRIICLVISALLLLPLAACAGKGTEDADAPGGTASPDGTAEPKSTDSPGSAPREDDFDNRFGRGYANLIETEDAYYYADFNGSYIYYYDKLCKKYCINKQDVGELSKLDLKNEIERILDEHSDDYKNVD